MIQLVVITLQHLNRSQSAIVLLINLGYFIGFVWALCTTRVYRSKVYAFKEVVQEICLMVLISTITLFSFTEKSDFSSSGAYIIKPSKILKF